VSAPLVADRECWMREQWPKLSRCNDLAKAMDYMLKTLAGVHPVPRRGAHMSFRTMRQSARCAALRSPTGKRWRAAILRHASYRR
jgi:hypothetical protein